MKRSKKIYILLAFTAMTVFSCKDSFFDINENPNLPTDEAVEPRFLLPMVLNATAKKMTINYDFAAAWTGYWSRGGNYGPSTPLENYDITTTYQQNNWVNGNTSVVNPAISWYDILMDAKQMEQKAAELDQPFYVAAAKIIKSIGYMYLVDLYNNVPYSQALNVKQYVAPAYDNGQDIYNDLLLQLDSANILLSQDFEVGPDLVSADILFGGVMENWRKLANTQKLKLLIRQSEVFGSNIPTEELSKITDDGFLMSGETAAVNPGYSQNQYQLNPFWGTYKEDQNEIVVDEFNVANNYLLNKYRDNNDARYRYVFAKARNPVDGVEYRGTDFGVNSPSNLKSPSQSSVAGPGLAKSANQDQWLFTSIESLFLQAEAAQRGWLTGISAKVLYEDAVKESYDWLVSGAADGDLGDMKIDDPIDAAEKYLAEEEIANWDGASNKLELIIIQKYLALPGINNFEAWTDYRRLGWPSDVPLSATAGHDLKIPLRLHYPQNEYSYNSANVAAQGTINPQTSRVFWDVD